MSLLRKINLQILKGRKSNYAHKDSIFTTPSKLHSSNHEAEEIPRDLCCHSKNQIILSTNSAKCFQKLCRPANNNIVYSGNCLKFRINLRREKIVHLFFPNFDEP